MFEQLFCHLFGDFLFQSDWLAMNKYKKWFPCLVHVLIYTSIFLFVTTSWKALLVIGVSHYILDHYPQIIRRLIWFKNHLGPHWVFVPWSKCNVTGYYDNVANEIAGLPYEKEHTIMVAEDKVTYGTRLNYVTVWLYIVTDNALHLFINFLAIKYL